ncbi:MAG: hypothetical protein ABSD43_06530 [Terracidiphilus sp.]|jgi:hypothetical protein
MPKLARYVQPIHFEDFSGAQFERLVFAYHWRSEKWRSLEWYGQTGSDLGRDIWGVRENGESVCIQCVNRKNLKFAKAEKDIAKVLNADNGIPHTFRIVAVSNLSARLRDKIKSHVLSLGVKVSDNWSGPEFEEFLRDGAESLLKRFVGGEEFPDTPADLKSITEAGIPPALRTPSLVFVFGVPLGDNDSASWMMTLPHFGPRTAHSCKINFYDEDRINIQHQWLVAHPNSPYPPPELTGESRKQVYVAEASPEGSSGGFQWNPLNPDSQHYTINIDCRDGVFTEKWEIVRVGGVLRSRVTIERGANWITKNPNQDPIVFKLEDPEFVSTPLATEVPKARPGKVVHPGWKPNHRFEIPAAILDPNGNLQIMSGIKLPDGSTLTDIGCWNILTRHFGDSPDEATTQTPPASSQILERLEVRGPIEQTWNGGNSTAYWLEVTNKSTAKTIRNVRAEVVKIEPPQTHLNWPVPLVVKHSQGKPVRDSTSLNAGQPGGFDLVSAHKGGPISVLHTVPDINSTLHQGNVFRLTVTVTGEDASPATKQFDVWQDAEGFLRCTPA